MAYSKESNGKLVQKAQASLGPKTLAQLLFSYYSIGMKITKHVLILPLLLAGLCMPATAQIKKALTFLGKELKNTHTAPQKGPKRFYFPEYAPQLNVELQRSLAATQQAAVAPTTLPPLPSHPLALANMNATEKEFLSIMHQEAAFYLPETAQATQLLEQARMTLLGERISPNDIEILKGGLYFVENNYLRELLQNTLADNDIEQFIVELSDYYTLDKTFEEAAFNYTLRHPHKRTLQLRRFMLNPFIDPRFKDPITSMLAAPKIHPLEEEVFKQALANLHQEYQRLQTGAADAPGIQQQVAYYDQLIDKVETFANSPLGGRAPKWNTRNPSEKELYNEVDQALYNISDYALPVLKSKKEELKLVMAKYSLKQRSRQETLYAYENFVKTTGLMYPRALTDSRTVLEGEEQLYDDLMYWRIRDEASMGTKIREIQYKYTTPTDPFYR